MTDQAENLRYRWIALIASSFAYSLTFGMIQAVGVLYPEWIRAFNATARYLSFVGSLPTAVGCILGPVCGMAVERFGCRTCGIAGGILTFVGRSLSSFANNVSFLGLTYGFLPGLGAVLTLVSFSSIVNSYFIKDRSFAESILGSGICLGSFFTSYMLQQFVQAFAWEGAMLLSGAIGLNVCICAAFFVPKSKIRDHPLNPWKAPAATSQQLNILNDEPYSETSCKDENAAAKKSQKGFLTRSFHLWKNPVFLLIATCDFLSWSAVVIPYLHLTERGRQLGLEANLAAWLSSTMGIAGVVGRPVTASFGTCLKIHPFWAYSINQAILGTATLLSPHWSNIYGLFAIAVVVGFFSNGNGFMKTSVAVMLGRQHFVDAYGWLLLLEGLGIGLGPFIAGLLVDSTHSYDWSFRFSGIVLLTSASLCLLKNPSQKLQARLRS